MLGNKIKGENKDQEIVEKKRNEERENKSRVKKVSENRMLNT